MIKKNKARDHIKKLWNSFSVKDVPLKEFRRRYLAATNPQKLQQDLAGVIQHRQMRQTQKLVAQHQKQKIDAAIIEK